MPHSSQIKPANLIYPSCYPQALADHEPEHEHESGSDELLDEFSDLYRDHGSPVGKSGMYPDQYGRLVRVCQHCGGHGEGHCRRCGGSGEVFAG